MWVQAESRTLAKVIQGRSSIAMDLGYSFAVLWIDKILHHLRNHDTPLFVGIYGGRVIF